MAMPVLRVSVSCVLAVVLLTVVPKAWGQDCNNNGVPDDDDISGGTSLDENGNSVPDECEFDCFVEMHTKLLASDGDSSDEYGLSVSVSGNVAVVGAPGRNEGVYNVGAAYVYRYNGSAWKQEAKLRASDGAEMDTFGSSVAVSGDVAVIGADGDDDNGSNSGSAYVFRYNGSAWVQEAKLLASDGAAGDWFGREVSVSGDVVVIGASSGSAYVFRYDGSEWAETKLTASDSATGGYLGDSVSVSGDVVLVGSDGDDENGDRSGAAYVFRYNGSTWEEEAKLLASDGAERDWFGASVSVSGDAAVIAAPGDDGSQGNSGSVYVFRYNGSGWEQEAKLTASDGAVTEHFALRVSVSGDVVVVTAWWYTGDPEAVKSWSDRSDPVVGWAYGYWYDGSTWVEAVKLAAFDGDPEDEFGYSVSISDNVVVVGAHLDDNENGFWAGSAYIQHVSLGDCNGNGSVDICDVEAGTSDDCDGNSVPDECDLAESDCNANASVDACDVLAGTSDDCDGNFVPDECDLAENDCNANGFVDACDVLAGTSDDCNSSMTPDECDIAAGTSEDIDGSGVPDECEDCNGNSIVDSFDITAGTSADCDANAVPDECELAENDCNENALMDVCETAAGTSSDCNENSVPDECEAGERDCNWNGVNDVCDIAAGTSEDLDESGLPDECEFDCALELGTKLLASDGATGDQFGVSVSVSGDAAVIGAQLDDDKGSDSGSAYVLRYDGAAWLEEAKLTASDGAAGDYFGRAVSLSDDVAVIGAYKDDDNGTDWGAAYVFRYNGSVWVEEAKLAASDGAADDRFGISVAVFGNVAVIGVYWDDDKGADSGSAYVFRCNGSVWVEEAKVTASDGAAGDYFGYAVSLSGDVAVIGAYLNDAGDVDSGAAYVFRYNGSTWVEEAKLTASDGAAGDQLGASVSVFGDAVVVGAGRNDDGGTDSGSAYVFRYGGSTWVEEAKLTASDGAATDYFGASVSLFGGAVLIGAYGDNDNGSDSGSAYAFRYDGSRWMEAAKFTDPNGAEGDRFGRAVSLDGDVGMIGAYYDDDNGSHSGSAFVLRASLDDCNENTLTDLCDIETGASPDDDGDGIPDECLLQLADLDDDGDVDLDDFSMWVDCLEGPGVPPEAGCEPADFDADDDVDLGDFAVFQRAFTGP